MQFVTVDFETYYDSKDYSLRGMTTHEYICDERFEAQCMTLKIDDGEPAAIPQEHIGDVLRSIDWSGVALIGHNLKFDGYILSYHYDVVPGLYLDTMSMALAVIGGRLENASLFGVRKFFGLSAKGKADALKAVNGTRWADMDEDLKRELMRYNIDDVEETWEIFQRLMPDFPMEEIPTLDWTIRAACNPVLHLDAKLLEDELRDVRRYRKDVVGRSGYSRAQLMSNEKFALVLEELGIDPPKKVSPTTGRETWAFDKKSKEFMDLKKHPDPLVRAVVEARLVVKSTIAETRAAKFKALADLGRPVPAPLTFSGAVQTHRFSGSGGLNFQNIPKKGRCYNRKTGEYESCKSRLRRAVRAPEGHVVVAADSSNIELRVCHWLAGAYDIFDVIYAGGDPYCDFATSIYGVEVNPKQFEEGTEEHSEHSRMRTLGKIAMLALQYGMGVDKYIDTVWDWTGMQLDHDEAQQVVDTFRSRFHEIQDMWYAYDDLLRRAAMGGYGMLPPNFNAPFRFELFRDDDGNHFTIQLPGGLKIRYPGLRLHRDDETGREELRFLKRYKRKKSEPWDYTWGGKVVENCTQGLAADVIRNQMRRAIARFSDELGLSPQVAVLQVHDEIVAMPPKDKAERVLEIMLEEMGRRPDWANERLILSAEGGIADTYGDIKKNVTLQ